MHQSAITLKKISRLSGFSVSTVSKALNDKKDIGVETKEMIMSIAKQHNYVPNYFATALRKQNTKTLAVIIPQISGTLYGSILSEIQNMTFELGYRLLVYQSFTSHHKEKECIRLINDGSVDGVIIISTLNNRCLIEKLQSKNIVSSVLWNLDDHPDRKDQRVETIKLYFNELLLKVL